MIDERTTTADAPTIDPELAARIEAAKDANGIVTDPALAAEYLLATQGADEATVPHDDADDVEG